MAHIDRYIPQHYCLGESWLICDGRPLHWKMWMRKKGPLAFFIGQKVVKVAVLAEFV